MKYDKITISGKICTGKSTLFKNLQQKLNWPVFSTSQYFRDIAKKNNLSLESAKEQNNKSSKEVDYKVRDLLKSEGKLIAEGWMTGIMADAFPGILKILLVCNDEIRIKRFALREKLSISEAKKRIIDREANLFAKLESIYKRTDFVDPKNYDLIIDTTQMSPTRILSEVITKLNLS